jgi:hypothetical protein
MTTELGKQIGFEIHEATGNICPKCGHYVGCCSCRQPIIIDAYFPPLKDRIAQLEADCIRKDKLIGDLWNWKRCLGWQELIGTDFVLSLEARVKQEGVV